MSELHLPWPPTILSPNSRAHWAKKASAAKKYRADCAMITRLSIPAFEHDGEVHLWIRFDPPDRRARDDDNLVAAFKSGRDGIADALGINDKRFRIHPFLSSIVHNGGRVVITFSKGTHA